MPSAPRPGEAGTDLRERRPRRRQAARPDLTRLCRGGAPEVPRFQGRPHRDPRSVRDRGPAHRHRPCDAPRAVSDGRRQGVRRPHPAREGDRHPRLDRHGGVRGPRRLSAAGHRGGGRRAGSLSRHLDADAPGLLRQALRRRSRLRPGQARGSGGALPCRGDGVGTRTAVDGRPARASQARVVGRFLRAGPGTRHRGDTRHRGGAGEPAEAAERAVRPRRCRHPRRGDAIGPLDCGCCPSSLCCRTGRGSA